MTEEIVRTGGCLCTYKLRRKVWIVTLLENQKVSFEINQYKGRSSAAKIKVIG